MAQRRTAPSRRMKPVFLVICEGQTEATYLEFLKRTFRSPIKIITNVVGTSITKSLLHKKVRDIRLTPYEQIKVFLMYDRDVATINQKIDECDCCKLLSNPCIEVWYLFHNGVVAESMSSKECIKKLKASSKVWSNYEKSHLTESQKTWLRERYSTAIEVAKKQSDINPSSTVYILIEELI